MPFADRVEAGRALATHLEHLRSDRPVVVGLPRGGVPVALEVANLLDAPLDVIVVRKLGVPFEPELAMGAIGEAGVRVVNRGVLQGANVAPSELATVEARERAELERRASRLRKDHPAISLAGRTVIVVDDGIATGATARAACQVARAHGAKRVVLATPVAPRGWTGRIGADADEFVAVVTPDHFYGVGEFYADFSETTDDQVIDCLERAATRLERAEGPEDSGRLTAHDREIVVDTGEVGLAGTLTIPAGAEGVVVFAHGSGSSRHSTRNRFVASVLNQAGLATLLFDLLSTDEETNRANVFDIGLLGRRLVDATRWIQSYRSLDTLPLGYFGASTGAAAALWAAAEPGSDVAAVVSRGGRPDLAGGRLSSVRAPTLLVVGSLDGNVLELNRRAQAGLRCPSRLAVVPGASHLFEEPGTLAAAATLARDWLVDHFRAASRGAVGG